MVNRILQIIDYKGITKSRFYKDTGLSNGFLDKVKDIGVSKLDYILKAYPDINIKWLISGDGDMLNTSIKEIDHSNSNPADFAQIKLFSVTASLLNNLKIINFLVSLADKEDCSLNTKELSSLEFYRGLEKFVYDLKTGKTVSSEENFEHLNRIVSDSYGFINHLILKSSKHLNIEIVDEYL